MGRIVTSVEDYLAGLPEERRQGIEAVRKVILANLDPALEEGIQYGMIGYFVPHNIHPAGYHCDPKRPVPYAALASQKNHLSLYLMFLYPDSPEANRFREAWEKTGHRLDMGKCCVRFRRVEEVPLAVIGSAIRRATAKKFLKSYQTALEAHRTKPKQRPAKKSSAER